MTEYGSRMVESGGGLVWQEGGQAEGRRAEGGQAERDLRRDGMRLSGDIGEVLEYACEMGGGWGGGEGGQAERDLRRDGMRLSGDVGEA
jgi:hypothetical protein